MDNQSSLTSASRATDIGSCSQMSPSDTQRVLAIALRKSLQETVREEGNFTIGCTKLFRTRTRFLIVILVQFCLIAIWSNILSFNFALICIGNDEKLMMRNGTSLQSVNQTTNYRFTQNQRTLLTSVVALAAILANFPLVILINRCGVRLSLTTFGLLSAAVTALIPTALHFGFYYLAATRFLQGISFAVSFPVIGAFTSKWTYYKQNGLFISILVAYVQLAPAISMPISGALCLSQWRWPAVFYAHAATSALLFIFFWILYRNEPSEHPWVSSEEKNKISVGKVGKQTENRRIPYCDIFITGSVWAVWIAAIGNFTTVNLMSLYAPVYLHEVVGYEVQNTGFASALPPFLQFIIKVVAGFTSDKVTCLGETGKLRMYNSFAFMGSAYFLFLLVLAPKSDDYLAVFFLGGAAATLGFTTGGFFKAGPLVSRHFSPFVTGNVTLGITVTMLFIPIIVSNLAPQNSEKGWHKVFLAAATILIVTNAIFCLMSSAEAAPWAKDERSHTLGQISMLSSSTRVGDGSAETAASEIKGTV
ncbi:hypothetical protein AB6A40_004728 [Gnathostoma spinigerum]|uniref:Major facilitator superfamily (MFS) profile domain-containing protein n=1 Tax=Gnathostoma spinigerum TaxID=75299 RepID=A0ABD6EL21_9BILA